MRRLTLKPLTIALATALAFAAPAGASTEVRESRGVVTAEPSKGPAAIQDYWSPARLRAAEDVAPPEGFDLPDGGEAATRSAATPPDIELPAGAELLYPNRVHGKLFLTLGGFNASCSGTIVTARSQNLILTAGHCVSLTAPENGGRPVFASNVLFVPGYRNGATPFGTFAGVRLAAPRIWLFGADPTFDVGTVNVAPNQAGVLPQPGLGSRGITMNRRPERFKKDTFEVFGYPSDPSPPYNGQVPIQCNSRFRGPDAVAGGIAVSPCHMQEGSSGGGWVRDGLLNSVVSHGGCFVPSTACEVIAGPYFEDAAWNLYAKASDVSKAKRKKVKRCKKGKKRKRSRKKLQNCLNKVETIKPTGA